MIGEVLRDAALVWAKQSLRLAGLQLLALSATSVVLAAVAWLLQGAAQGLMAYLVADPAEFEPRALAIGVLVALAVAVLSLPLFAAGAAATVRVTDQGLSGTRPRAWRAVARGFARSLPALATIGLGLLLAVVTLVLTPVLVLVGLLGLLLSGGIALARRRRPGMLPRWPATRVWLVLAIPFGAFAVAVARAGLMLPIVVLDGVGPIRAYRLAADAMRGRELAGATVLGAAFLLLALLAVGSGLLGVALWGEVGGTLLGGVVQLLALPIPFVAMTALYRRAAGPSGRLILDAPRPAAPRRAPRALHASRVAIITVVALALGAAATPVLAAPAAALDAGLELRLSATTIGANDGFRLYADNLDETGGCLGVREITGGGEVDMLGLKGAAGVYGGMDEHGRVWDWAYMLGNGTTPGVRTFVADYYTSTDDCTYDFTYEFTSDPVSLTVIPAPRVCLELSPGSPTYGEPVTITVVLKTPNCSGAVLSDITGTGRLQLTASTYDAAHLPPEMPPPYEGSTNGEVELAIVGGVAQFTVTGLSNIPSYYDFGFGFDGDGVSWGSARANKAFSVAAPPEDIDTTTAVTAVTQSPTVAGTVAISAAVTPAEGTRADGGIGFVVDGGAPVAAAYDPTSGIASTTVGELAPGSHAVSAVFTGGIGFADSISSDHAFDVVPLAIPVVTCDDGTFDYNECTIPDDGSIQFEVAMPEALDGTFQVVRGADGSDPVAGASGIVAAGVGTATVSAAALGLGNHTLYARFTADGGTAIGLSAPKRLDVLARPTLELAVSETSRIYGQPLTITATVSGGHGTPAGTIHINDHRLQTVRVLPLVDGTAAFVVPDALPGDGPFAGLYVPPNEGAVYLQTPLEFPEVSVRAASTAITGGPAGIVQFGAAVDYAFSVANLDATGVAPSGRLVLTVDGIELPAATLVPSDADTSAVTIAVPSETFIPTGDFDWSLSYSPDAGFEQRTLGGSVELGAAMSTTSLTSDLSAAQYGDPVTLTAEVVIPGSIVPVDAGTVTFASGGRTLGTAIVAAGRAVLAVADLGIGAHTVTASYGGMSGVNGSTGSTPLSITKAAMTVTLTGEPSWRYGEQDDYVIAVGGTSVRPADGSTVAITATLAGGAPRALGSVSLVDGAGTLPAAAFAMLDPGEYSLGAAYPGDELLAAAEGTQAFVIDGLVTDIALDSVSDTTVGYGDALEAVVTIVNESTTAMPEGEVELSWFGVTVGSAMLSAADDSGTGRRTVTIVAEFGPPVMLIDTGWLTARFIPATGFLPSTLHTDAPEERVRVTVAPLQTEVTVTSGAALGLPLAATATVRVVGEDDFGIVPAGTIVFLVTSPHGFQEFGPVSLVDGSATLETALGPLADLLVDVAGSWSVRATYTKGGIESRYVAESPHHTAVTSTVVAPGSVAVVVEAPPTVHLGRPATAQVEVLGAVTPTGTAWVELGGARIGDEVALVDGAATLPFEVPEILGLGPQELRVGYSGDGTSNAAHSDAFSVEVTRAPTTVAIETSAWGLALLPAIVQAPLSYRATVTAAVGGSPSGVVDFWRDDVLLGQRSVGADGTATLTLSPALVWAGTIRAEFVSSTQRYADSAGTLAHSWVEAPVALTLHGAAGSQVGELVEYTVTARFDSTDFQFLPEAFQPTAGPTGFVMIGDGQGAECMAALTPGVAQPSSGRCQLALASLGTHEITASYGGDATYASGDSATLETVVTKGVPTLSLVTQLGGDTTTSWPGLSTITAHWSVAGAVGGTVTLLRGAETVCTSSSLSGSCEVPIPRYRDTTGADRLRVEYSGSPLWDSGAVDLQGTIVACIPFQAPIVHPAGTGTVAVSHGPSCGGGTGYLVGELVGFSATPTPGYRVTGFAGGSLAGGLGAQYEASKVTLWPGGEGTMLVSPVLQVVGGQVVPFTGSALTAAQCVSVRVAAEGLPGGRDVSLNALVWDYQRSCGVPSRAVGDTTWELTIPVDSQLRVRYQPAFVAERTKFYGWQTINPAGGASLADGLAEPYATSALFTITGDPASRYVEARFGPICYQSAPSVVQPDGGRIALDLPAPNCTDPQSGATGYRFGTIVTGQLVDDYGMARVLVSRSYSGGRWFEDWQWQPNRPVYFDGWTGDTGSFVETASTTADDGTGVRRTTRALRVTLGDRPATISAAYGRCAVLDTAVAGDPPGSVRVLTAGNCPLATSGQTWYRLGTSVSLTAIPPADPKVPGWPAPKFLGWGGLPLSGAAALNASAAFVIDRDVTATASFGRNASCRVLNLTSIPAGSLRLEPSFGLGPNACASSYGPRFYDTGTEGNWLTVDATPATAAADGAEIVFASSTGKPGTGLGSGETVANVWSRSSQFSGLLWGQADVVAYACSFVQVDAVVRGPDGQATNAGATNLARGGADSLAEFVAVQDGNCSIGADPRSGYGDYAWTVGTRLVPLAAADPAAYRFTGWSGDVTGTTETPDRPLALEGPGRRATGGEYHFRVTANFQAICYTLDTTKVGDTIEFPNLPGQMLRSGGPKVEVLTNPNCPGVDPAKRMYLGGTAVVVHASDGGDVLFRDWQGSTDTVDQTDGRWASLVMTRDRALVPYFSEKSVGEYVTSYGTDIGNGMAQGAKLMAGFAAAAVAAYAKTVISKVALVASAVGYIAQGLEAVGVRGAVIDGMKNSAQLVNDMIALVFAPLDCISAWSAGGENTAIFAAQNLLGTAIVQAAAVAPQSQGQDPTSTLAKLKAAASQAKASADPAIKAAQALNGAKNVYQAGQNGGIGLDLGQSAADAWTSASSASVFTTCLSSRAASTLASFDKTIG